MKKIRSFYQQPIYDEAPVTPDFEQFQRLSAYFDGEATPDERREIQHLLDTNPEVKRQYHQLRQLRQALQLIPIPTSISAQYLGQRVLARLRRTQLRSISLWGSGAIAALLVAGFVGQAPQWGRTLFADNSPLTPTTTFSVETNAAVEDEALAVVLNRPVLQIPKLASATESPQ
ncbi:hypothetical protein NIES970_18680 [[Synechococcus] sp. NIES-970]|nr:hypothetical protein NIES970_18680 [[Synechococcus] sp. NIES-970]